MEVGSLLEEAQFRAQLLFSGRKGLLLGRDRYGRDEKWKKMKGEAFLGRVSSAVRPVALAQPG